MPFPISVLTIMPPRRRPPEDLVTVSKCSLESIVQSQDVIPIIESVVQRIHKVTVKTYQFIKLYYLNGLEEGQLPRMDNAFVIEVMRVVAGYEVNSRANLDLRGRLRVFYNLHMPDYQEVIDLCGLGTLSLT